MAAAPPAVWPPRSSAISNWTSSRIWRFLWAISCYACSATIHYCCQRAGKDRPAALQSLCRRRQLRHSCGFGDHARGARQSDSAQRSSATLFLSDPDEYEGGEPLIETTFGAQPVKLPAGSLVLYPLSSLHQVTAVTHGARICAFFWIQSLVRDDGERALLFDLDQNLQQLRMQLPAMISGCWLSMASTTTCCAAGPVRDDERRPSFCCSDQTDRKSLEAGCIVCAADDSRGAVT